MWLGGLLHLADLSDDATHQKTWIKPYYAAFDGLRGLAIAMVFIDHYSVIAQPGGSTMGLWTGVDIFFVLSGFLITGILYDTRQQPRYFRNFFIRRALRILPICYGFFLCVLLLTPLLHLVYSRYLWTNPFYASNLYIRGALLGRHGNPTVLFISHKAGIFLRLKGTLAPGHRSVPPPDPA